MPAAIIIKKPANLRSGVVFASPHSGRKYPADFLKNSQLSARVLRSSEDAFVDELLVDVPRIGATLVTTDVPRAYVDFNRGADELDPALIAGAPSAGLNPRVASGLGVIARVVGGNRAIYAGKLSQAEAKHRIDRYWSPYHAGLQQVLKGCHQSFGQVLLCDIHSMPSSALDGQQARWGKRPDIVIGDRWGASCDPGLAKAVEDILSAAGLVVARNTPFAGAYIARHYGKPVEKMHALQIEIDRRLYLDEARVEPSGNFRAFQALMDTVCAQIAELISDAQALDMAAE